MLDRQFVWNDPRIVRVTSKFIPAAEQCDRLQAGRDPDCLLFQKFTDRGHSQSPGGTRQGTYVVAPSGLLLASLNSPDPREILAMLETGLSRWEKLTHEERLLSPPPGEAQTWRRWEGRYPQDGLVLRVYCRDLPRESVPAQWRGAWNQDYAWFLKAEARAFVPADPRAGATLEVPRDLVERLARFHLLDSVRAGTEPYAREAVERARLTATVLAREGDLVSLRFEGATRTAEAGRTEAREGQEITLHQKRGFEARLLGRARYSLAEERFVSFELLAVGTRWGATVCNMRVGDLDPTLLGVLLTLAGKSAVERLPPTFVSRYGWK